MRPRTTLFVIAVLAGCALIPCAARAQDPVDQALKATVTYEFGQSREPLTVVADMVREALAAPDQRQAVAAKLAALLGSDATYCCKQFVCRQLAIAAGPENVPAIAPLLADPVTADMARYALEPIPGPEASKALIDALPSASNAVKTGIINSLGQRHCPKAVPALASLMLDPDVGVAEAALAALGKIANADAAQALGSAKEKVPANLQIVLADSHLLCADGFLEAGDTGAATTIYETLFAPSQPIRIRVAAFQGLVAAKGPEGTDLVVDALTGSDTVLQGVATGIVRGMPGPEPTKAFANQLKNMSVPGQVRLLSALADRGDKSCLSTVTRFAKHKTDQLRIAGLQALAQLGDDSSVPLLAKAAANEQRRTREAARGSLYVLQGKEVDAAILANIGKGNDAVRSELIRATVERNMTGAVPTLLSTASRSSEEVRVAALKALAGLAGPDSIEPLVTQLLAAKTDPERAEAEKTLVTVGRKIADANARAQIPLAALSDATDIPVRCSLIKVLGEFADPTALDVLRSAAGDGNADVRNAGIRALAQWPTADVIQDLLPIAKGAKDQTHRVLALRGYVRLLALPSSRPSGETIAKYKEAMAMAARAEDKKTVLAGLANLQDPGALALAAPFLADDGLRGEAVAASLKVAQAISGAYRTEATTALKKIIEVAKDDETKKQAQSALKVIEQLDGYVTAWHLSGPYTQENKSGSDLFDIAFPPEDANAKNVVWRIMPPSTDPNKAWLLGIDAAIGGDNRVAYLRTTLVAAKAQDALVEVGSDDGIKVWLNGEVVHANNASRGRNPGEDKFNVKLKEGANPLLLKVNQGSSQWAACVRLRTLEGAELTGVEAKLQ